MENIIDKYMSYDIATEFTFDDIYDNEQSDVKEVLKNLLDSVAAIKPKELSRILDLFIQGPISKVNKKDASIILISKIMNISAKSLKYELCQYGQKFLIYNSKKWVEIESRLFKEFLKALSSKIGVSQFISSSVSFVNKLEKQIKQDAYFELSTPKEVTYVNVNNGIVSISKKGVDFINHNPKLFLTHLIETEYESGEVYEEFKLLDSIIPSKEIQKSLQHAVAQVFVKDFRSQVKICLYGLEDEQVSSIVGSLKKVIPSNFVTEYFRRDDAELEDLFINYERIKKEPHLLEALIVIPCVSDEKFLYLDTSRALFNWLVSGVKEIVENKSVYISDECEEFKKRFNTVSLFVDETALVKTEKNSKSIVSSYQDIFKQYELFCELNDEEALGRGKFNRELKALGFKSTRRDSGNVWFAKFS